MKTLTKHSLPFIISFFLALIFAVAKICCRFKKGRTSVNMKVKGKAPVQVSERKSRSHTLRSFTLLKDNGFALHRLASGNLTNNVRNVKL